MQGISLSRVCIRATGLLRGKCPQKCKQNSVTIVLQETYSNKLKVVLSGGKYFKKAENAAFIDHAGNKHIGKNTPASEPVKDSLKEQYGENWAMECEHYFSEEFRIQIMRSFNNPKVFHWLPPLTASKEDIDYPQLL